MFDSCFAGRTVSDGEVDVLYYELSFGFEQSMSARKMFHDNLVYVAFVPGQRKKLVPLAMSVMSDMSDSGISGE